MMVLAILGSYAVQFYVPMEIMWPQISTHIGSSRNKLMAEYAFRTMLVLFTCKEFTRLFHFISCSCSCSCSCLLLYRFFFKFILRLISFHNSLVACFCCYIMSENVRTFISHFLFREYRIILIVLFSFSFSCSLFFFFTFFFVLFLYVVGLAAAIPKLDLFISLVGAFSSSFLALIFPPVLELITFWPNPGKWTVFKDVSIIIFGVIGFFAGTYASIESLVTAFSS